MVERARQKGYFFREKGLISGTRAVLVSVPSTNQTPLAAITAGAVDRRLTAPRAVEVADVLQARVQKLLRAL